MFIMITLLYLFTALMDFAFICSNRVIPYFFTWMRVPLFWSQSLMILLIPFIRLYIVFKGTLMPLSKCTIRFRVTLFVIMAISIILSSLLLLIDENSSIGVALGAFTILQLIFLGIATMILFIRKLMIVYRHLSNDEIFIGIITQLSILTIFSVLFTLFNLGLIFIFIVAPSLYWTLGFSTLFDVISNFWFIMLSFESMNGYYMKICGCLDLRCRKLWKKMVTSKDEQVIMEISKDTTKASEGTTNTSEKEIDGF